MDRIALQWAVASSLAGAYGATDRARLWRIAGQIAADCPEDPDAAGQFYASVFSAETMEDLGVPTVV